MRDAAFLADRRLIIKPLQKFFYWPLFAVAISTGKSGVKKLGFFFVDYFVFIFS